MVRHFKPSGKLSKDKQYTKKGPYYFPGDWDLEGHDIREICANCGKSWGDHNTDGCPLNKQTHLTS